MADQSPHSVDLVGSFTEKIKQASDAGNAAAGDTAIALAIMELARQKRIENIFRYMEATRNRYRDGYTGLEDLIYGELGLDTRDPAVEPTT